MPPAVAISTLNAGLFAHALWVALVVWSELLCSCACQAWHRPVSDGVGACADELAEDESDDGADELSSAGELGAGFDSEPVASARWTDAIACPGASALFPPSPR